MRCWAAFELQPKWSSASGVASLTMGCESCASCSGGQRRGGGRIQRRAHEQSINNPWPCESVEWRVKSARPLTT